MRKGLLLYIAICTIIVINCGARNAQQIDATEINNEINNGELVDYKGVVIKGDINIKYKNLPAIILKNCVITGSVDFSDCTSSLAFDFSGTEFQDDVNFDGVTFRNVIEFKETKFDKDAKFAGTIFDSGVNFQDAVFERNANFNRVNFGEGLGTNFEKAEFKHDADFTGSIFSGNVEFSGANFKNDADFTGSIFSGNVEFSGANFSGISKFATAVFGNGQETIYFDRVAFCEDADFTESKFSGDANFVESVFFNDAKFKKTVFHRKADFEKTRFEMTAYFANAEFYGEARLGSAYINNLYIDEIKIGDDGRLYISEDDLKEEICYVNRCNLQTLYVLRSNFNKIGGEVEIIRAIESEIIQRRRDDPLDYLIWVIVGDNRSPIHTLLVMLGTIVVFSILYIFLDILAIIRKAISHGVSSEFKLKNILLSDISLSVKAFFNAIPGISPEEKHERLVILETVLGVFFTGTFLFLFGLAIINQVG